MGRGDCRTGGVAEDVHGLEKSLNHEGKPPIVTVLRRIATGKK
jgi:hypothetical protein